MKPSSENRGSATSGYEGAFVHVDWKNPVEAGTILASIAFLFACIFVAGPFGEFLWSLLIVVFALPVLAYAKAIRAAKTYRIGATVKFGFRGTLSLLVTCFSVYTVLLTLFGWVTSPRFPSFQAVVDAVDRLNMYRHPILMSIIGILVLPLTLYIQGWSARRLSKGKKAMPLYVKVINFVVLAPIVLCGLLLLLPIIIWHRW
ncbi:hypothetical protein C7408_1562 [Paraburkholderia caballeronis]|nr:hypothetical protein C7408_1562 [Paraburkholderia caballeronis]TDV05561.1 hypothetical protein C7406_1542 [Paraburkholderia caballeronis]TDV15332.1 hypothetical protein C7404_1562 [Paraburkholderia caballeronis]TDV22709.1 hypothetical protein C7405_1411 [Paraburkholderia caballeronis]